MEFKDLVLARRSIRQYTDRPVTADELMYIMNAAINAPSACNMQSWHFYVVSDPKVKEGFKEFCADWISTAPIVVVICTAGEEIVSRFGEKAKKFIIQDTALAMENMLLAAADIGFGGCIIGAYDDDKCRALLDIPAEYSPVALMPIGEPAVVPSARSRKPISEVVTYIGNSFNI
ncbi:MAG: nitroreductase family protein [Oscillospiraceae bacterium]|nr:nitroreductase family protein [Oscillospiraceae bacterium]